MVEGTEHYMQLTSDMKGLWIEVLWINVHVTGYRELRPECYYVEYQPYI